MSATKEENKRFLATPPKDKTMVAASGPEVDLSGMYDGHEFHFCLSDTSCLSKKELYEFLEKEERP